MVEQVVEGLQHQHIGVKIDATLMVEGVHAYVVGGEGPLALADGLAHIVGSPLDIKVLGVPQLYLVVGHHPTPCLHAPFNLGWVRVAAHPAEMYLLRYHSNTVCVYI